MTASPLLQTWLLDTYCLQVSGCSAGRPYPCSTPYYTCLAVYHSIRIERKQAILQLLSPAALYTSQATFLLSPSPFPLPKPLKTCPFCQSNCQSKPGLGWGMHRQHKLCPLFISVDDTFDARDHFIIASSSAACLCVSALHLPLY